MRSILKSTRDFEAWMRKQTNVSRPTFISAAALDACWRRDDHAEWAKHHRD
jgi:hypothetical protein